MGNIIQTLSGKNKNNSDDNVVVKRLDQQLQLFRANPVFTMFLKLVQKLEHQVELFKAKLDFTIVTKHVKKVEQHAQLFNEKYVFPMFYKFLDSLPLVPQEEEDNKSMVLYQVTFLFSFCAVFCSDNHVLYCSIKVTYLKRTP